MLELRQLTDELLHDPDAWFMGLLHFGQRLLISIDWGRCLRGFGSFSSFVLEVLKDLWIPLVVS